MGEESGKSLLDFSIRDLVEILGLWWLLMVESPSAFIASLPLGTCAHISYTSGKYFQVSNKKFNCTHVMNRMMSVLPSSEWPPPRKIPSTHRDEFTQRGELPQKRTIYIAQRYSGTTAAIPVWTPNRMKKLISEHKKGKQIGGYGLYEENALRDATQKYIIKGKDGAVIGSESPWVEAILFANGAINITTIEYGTILSRIPNHRAFTPFDFARSYLANQIQFDFVASVSSLEHSGLGRYGDSLNPYGDIDAAEEVYCMLKPRGIFFISLPYAHHSEIVWNAHRIYGPERMRLFAAGYQQLDYFGELWKGQGVFVLQKPNE
jgi:hypothetical protein